MPAIDQDLCLGSHGAQLALEELPPQPTVERLDKALLPLGSWLDVSRTGSMYALTAVQHVLRNESRPVVRPDEFWLG